MQFLSVSESRILILRGISVMREFIPLEKGRTFYTSNAGLKELKIEIAKYLYRK